MFVDATRLNALDVLRQANDAVAVRALQVGFCHQLRYFLRILLGQALAGECVLDELLQGVIGEGVRCVHGSEVGDVYSARMPLS